MYDGVEKLMKYAKGVSAKTHGFDSNGNDVDIDYKKMVKIVKDELTELMGGDAEGINGEYVNKYVFVYKFN